MDGSYEYENTNALSVKRAPVNLHRILEGQTQNHLKIHTENKRKKERMREKVYIYMCVCG